MIINPLSVDDPIKKKRTKNWIPIHVKRRKQWAKKPQDTALYVSLRR